jgi:methyl-accepting chemotaxis protein
MMNLRNMTVGKKLIAEFFGVAAINLLLGGLGYYGAVKSDQDIKEIGGSCLPGMQSLLHINEKSQRIKAAHRTLLNPDVTVADRKRQLELISQAMEEYQQARKVYEQLSHTSEETAAWKEFLPAWEQWCKDNDEFLKLSGERDALMEVYSQQAKSADVPYRQAVAQVCADANRALVAFKLQVQEWKNILLRGNDAAKYDKHAAAFDQAEKTVQAQLKCATDLMRQLGLDAKAGEQAMQKHTALGVQYREALKKYDKANPRAGQVADFAVTGIDRPAAQCIDEIVAMAHDADRKFTEVMRRLDRQAMTVCRASETKALALLDKMVEADGIEADSASTRAATRANATKTLSLVAMFISVALALGLGILVSRGITRPIRRAADMLKDISEGEGDLTKRLTVDNHDEIGETARYFNQFVEKLQGTMGRIVANVNTVASSATELSATAAQLASGAEETTNQSAQVAAATEQMSANMTTMAASSEQMSANVKTVSAAIEQVTAGVGEMAKSAERAAAAAANATQLVDASNTQVGDLGSAAEQIGKVIEVIQDIAEQTNLLALNATIEAARAGDAGKGFAVVATEVKELARQTAGATEDIRKRIDGIQRSTGLTVKSIGGIGDVIRQVNDLSRTIASAVEEQSVTTKEIARNVAQTSTAAQTVAKGVAESASASQEIARIIVGVDQAAKQTAQGASQTQSTGRGLSTVAEQLRSLVGQFKTGA